MNLILLSISIRKKMITKLIQKREPCKVPYSLLFFSSFEELAFDNSF